jgi:hypothetical protein
VQDAPAQDRVREQANPVQLDQDGRVTDVDEPSRCGYAVPAALRSYEQSAAMTRMSSAMIRTAQIGW